MKQRCEQQPHNYRAVKRIHTSSGTILLSSLGLLISISVLVSLLLLLSEYALNIVTMQQEADRAYWLASSEAMTTVKELNSSGVLIDTAERITTPSVNGSKGTIITEVRKTTNPNILMIYVEASIGAAVHTISFQYNKSQRDIVDWTDSDVKLK